MLLDESEYYTYMGVHYHILFHLVWVMNTNCKPINCLDCLYFATEKNKRNENVFMGYCESCNLEKYNNTRTHYKNTLYIDMEDEYYSENPYFKDGYDSY